MSLRLNRRSESGLVPYVPPKGQEWRLVLRSRAWQQRRPGFWARQTARHWGVRSIDNPESRPLSGRDGVLVFGGLALATFVVIVVFGLLGVWT
jgi:hypothetical protein